MSDFENRSKEASKGSSSAFARGPGGSWAHQSSDRSAVVASSGGGGGGDGDGDGDGGWPRGSQSFRSSTGSSRRENNKSSEPQPTTTNSNVTNVSSPSPINTTTNASNQTSGTQRLGSIEILNENKQRQIQLKQQESFKQHLEQRQKIIQLQQQHQQVETSAPDYVRPYSSSGSTVETTATGLKSSSSSSATTTTTYSSPSMASATNKGSKAQARTGIAVNPFDGHQDDEGDELKSFRSGKQQPTTTTKMPPDDGDKSTTVSGKSGFLSALMDEPPEADSRRSMVMDEGADELAANETTAGNQSRYEKVAQAGSCSYNYEQDPNRRPLYMRDLPTILNDLRGSRKLVILIVAIALLLDNMLLTSVVPIIPAYLYRLRVEREHRDLLASSARAGELNRTKSTATTAGGRQLFNSLDINRDGQLDDDEIQAELARRVNKSLANVEGRFSGSFFHPRVVGANRRQPNDGDSDDDDDDGDDNDTEDMTRVGSAGQRGRKPRAQTQKLDRQSQAIDGNDDDDDDSEYEEVKEDDDDDNEGGDNGKQRPDKKRSKQASRGSSKVTKNDNNESRRPPPTSPKTGSKDTDDDDDDDDDDDEGENNNRNDDQNDDDDEDVGDAMRWNKLRSSLKSMARMSNNDTEALGGMCLSMVMGRPNYFDPDRKGSSSSSSSGRRGPATNKDNYDDDATTRPRPTVSQVRPKSNAGGPDKGQTRAKTTSSSAAKPLRPNPADNNLARRPEKTTAFKRPPQPMAAPPKGASETDKSNAALEDKFSHLDDDVLIINHQDIVDESFEVGVMFASKPIVQALVNPFVGAITNRVGFTLPMFLGFTIMFLSTLVFAFGETYATLFLARAIQGVGSACTSVAGMSMIADRFPDDAERGNAMAIALGGLALGVVIGPPFGGFMYEFFGKPSPFIVLAILALADGLLQLLVLQPRVSKSQEEGASLMTLIKDPYILVAAGAITFANTGIGILEPALPLWMMDTMQAKNWEQGVAFLPAALSYLFSTNLFGNLGLRIGRWRSAMLGLVIIGCSLLLIPFATRVDHLILPNGAIGFAIGMVDSTMMPMLGYLVDIRHTSVYGSVYAIGDVAFCASFVFGPALSGTLVELIGFEGLVITTALICFGFAPLLLLLRNPPARTIDNDDAQLQEQSSLRYVNYNHLDSPDEEAQLTADTRLKSKSYVR